MTEDIIRTNDYVLLTSAGFRSQFAEVILWKDDSEGYHWQAQLGEDSSDPVTFIRHKPDFRREGQEMLTRKRFAELFLPEKKRA